MDPEIVFDERFDIFSPVFERFDLQSQKIDFIQKCFAETPARGLLLDPRRRGNQEADRAPAPFTRIGPPPNSPLEGLTK
jgi:hypothetical protein